MRLSQLTMRIINFSGNTTYVSDGESYLFDGRNHNIQRIDKKWMVDGRPGKCLYNISNGFLSI